ncbi:hypothetical protein C1280_27495 [Gemmata obscuriglobus]|uniref:Uncharacterized protein n=1 Tax=Gemmata obscuriglobus TaxID=114 RepID=A0A2Z3H644_9BACT|nr:hypothetical protein C1280_27495 [Gemmata obscuriglobus]
MMAVQVSFIVRQPEGTTGGESPGARANAAAGRRGRLGAGSHPAATSVQRPARTRHRYAAAAAHCLPVVRDAVSVGRAAGVGCPARPGVATDPAAGRLVGAGAVGDRARRGAAAVDRSRRVLRACHRPHPPALPGLERVRRGRRHVVRVSGERGLVLRMAVPMVVRLAGAMASAGELGRGDARGVHGCSWPRRRTRRCT